MWVQLQPQRVLVMDAVLEAIDATGAQAVSSTFHFTLHWVISSDLGELVGSYKGSTAHVLRAIFNLIVV